MVAANTCPDDDCATLGVEAVSLEDFEAVEDDGDLTVFDETAEDAWVQSDLYLSRTAVR